MFSYSSLNFVWINAYKYRWCFFFQSHFSIQNKFPLYLETRLKSHIFNIEFKKLIIIRKDIKFVFFFCSFWNRIYLGLFIITATPILSCSEYFFSFFHLTTYMSWVIHRQKNIICWKTFRDFIILSNSPSANVEQLHLNKQNIGNWVTAL